MSKPDVTQTQIRMGAPGVPRNHPDRFPLLVANTILGGGWATAGFSAATIDAAHRGIGFLLHEGGQPVRLRTFYLADDDLSGLARRAEQLRAAHAETAKLPPPNERHAEPGGAA